MIAETARIVESTGLAYDDAAKKAEQLVTAKEKADGRGKDGDGGRSKIKGYSQEQGDAGDARSRASQRVNDSRARSEEAVARTMGMGGMSASKLTPRSGDIGAKTPATETPKAAGESELVLVFKSEFGQFREVLEKALA